MELTDTLLLKRSDVVSLLNIDECMDAVENAFCLYAKGKALPPKVLGIHCDNGGFHIKAGISGLKKKYFAAKVNANFPGNPKQCGLPTIQGVIVVCDAMNGRLLALMDSIEITIIRTGAATAVAAKYLALPGAAIVTICGCGSQGRISLKALLKVRQLKKVFAFDIDSNQREKFKQEFDRELEIIPVSINDLPAALHQSQVVITCTPSKEPFIHADDIMPGTFIAAVGADNEDKQELFSDLIASSKIVVDLVEQSASIGELHHAIKQGLITMSGVYAELGFIIAGKKAGRESENEIIIFDSTGTALQDVAAAVIVYEKAVASGIANRSNFSNQDSTSDADAFKKNERDIRALRWWFPFK
ncbi:MAG TPA: ornithine cyclodeaminase family protein [Chitinophagaceae bacterium]|nr:ornithine cyclodeaminase family protein [Chitinophagaceae bacterium]